jgi:hypothetical protein
MLSKNVPKTWFQKRFANVTADKVRGNHGGVVLAFLLRNAKSKSLVILDKVNVQDSLIYLRQMCVFEGL